MCDKGFSLSYRGGGQRAIEGGYCGIEGGHSGIKGTYCDIEGGHCDIEGGPRYTGPSVILDLQGSRKEMATTL